jgi:hypothetical protein
MGDDLVNGWYKCIKSSVNLTKGEFYWFENGRTKDDEGNQRPHSTVSPQRYNDPLSEQWFRWAGLVPADENEMRKMKHDTMEDYRINGFYKATKTDAAWSEGKQYYFRDGYTIDDNGKTRPEGGFLSHGCGLDESWLTLQGLVPATEETDIFDRVNEAAVNCATATTLCIGKKCPYCRVPNCKDQMVNDFKALREMRRNQKEEEHEAIPYQGGFVYDLRDAFKAVTVGHLYRDIKTLEVFKVAAVSTRWKHQMVIGFLVEFEGISTKYKRRVNFLNMSEFCALFEPWDGNKDGGTFGFVALEDLSNEGATRLFLDMKGHRYQVVDGRAGESFGDMRFRSFDEAAACFGNDKLILVNGCGALDDPTEGLYTGFAVATASIDKLLTKGKIYRFVHGVVKLDNGFTMLFEFQAWPFDSYFRPVVNMEEA